VIVIGQLFITENLFGKGGWRAQSLQMNFLPPISGGSAAADWRKKI
jgi:hypothetical protein